tara:strand:+ start:48 stop:575 length:528 start_codon:yes stop_codon:yes gene_type:complete
MANLKDSPLFKKYDDYYTQKTAWEKINHLIPKDKIIWEGCMYKSYLSKSPQYLEELGNKVVYDTKQDILKDYKEDYDIIITNIPFDIKIKIPILERLVELDKPFIIIMNSMNTFTKYFRQIFKDKFHQLQIITPSNKLHFNRLEGDKIIETNKCSFYCIYLCYKMNFKTADLWLE